MGGAYGGDVGQVLLHPGEVAGALHLVDPHPPALERHHRVGALLAHHPVEGERPGHAVEPISRSAGPYHGPMSAPSPRDGSTSSVHIHTRLQRRRAGRSTTEWGMTRGRAGAGTAGATSAEGAGAGGGRPRRRRSAGRCSRRWPWTGGGGRGPKPETGAVGTVTTHPAGGRRPVLQRRPRGGRRPGPGLRGHALTSSPWPASRPSTGRRVCPAGSWTSWRRRWARRATPY